MATSKGYWREPFRDAERFVVGRLDIDREKGSWSHVHPTLRRARNHAGRLEAKREMFDIRVAENKRAHGV